MGRPGSDSRGRGPVDTAQYRPTLHQTMGSLGILEFLEQDDDLIAIIEKPTEHAARSATNMAFCNISMRRSRFYQLLWSRHASASLSGKALELADAFQDWLSAAQDGNPGGLPPTCVLDGLLWTAKVVKQQWLILRGTFFSHEDNHLSSGRSPISDAREALDELSLQPSPKKPRTDFSSHQPESSPEASRTGENVAQSRPWNLRLPHSFLAEPLSEHQKFVRDFDWASTSLGPMDQWPSQLRQMVDMVLINPNPASVLWGEGLSMIYNEAYLDIAGVKHPSLMGHSPATPFAEVWEQYFAQPVKDSARTKKAVAEERLMLLLERLGFPEETYMTFAFLPLLGDQNNVVGFYHPVVEMTKEVLAERRMTMLLKTSERTAGASDLDSFWKLVLDSLRDNELDVPFAILYSIKDKDESADDEHCSSQNSGSSHGSTFTSQCVLEGSIGFPSAHDALSDKLNLDDSVKGFAPAFRSVVRTRKALLLQTEDGSLSENLIHGLQKRGYNDTCKAVVICPLQPTTNDRVLGVLVLGLASTRPFDEDYQVFIDLLSRQLQSSLASVVLFEDEKRRGRSAAEEALYQQTQLLMKLQERARENEIFETRYRLLAERAPVGIFELNADGTIKFANQVWYDITGYDPADTSTKGWMSAIVEQDMARAVDNWKVLAEELKPSQIECRFRQPWKPAYSDDVNLHLDYTWILASAYPVLDENGKLAGVTGTFTDITQQKRLSELQTQRINDMVEQKRQRENFFDMTSHELRNPLNAMLQCAEDLHESLEHLRSNGSTRGEANLALVEDCLESAQTILYCGKHQQHIINDILTLSKLDARLLGINPLSVQPVEVVANALRLFDSEARAADVQLDLRIDDSYHQLALDHVFMDPSRVVQILVNFVANGIKFTKDRAVRRMRVTVSASKKKPSTTDTNVKFVPSGREVQDPTTRDEWGDGEIIYLYFCVDDTGPGLTPAEMAILFGRFSQASPKTHAHYGGSGLGLFISQHLAELQGGEVGLASEVDVGSSFVFYIKARRAPPPEKPSEGQVSSTIPNMTSGPSTAQAQAQSHKRHHSLISRLDQVTVAPPTSSTNGEDSARLHVLIVEDNLINQRVLNKQLQKLGYKTSIANNGAEALSIIQKSRFWQAQPASGEPLDVVLMDIEMPVMDGKACVRRIRDLQAEGLITCHVPIIAVTANARPDQILGVKGYGFDDSVSKPYSIPDLVKQMEKLVAG